MNLKIGNHIAKYRKEMQVTQAELAAFLGVSSQAVSKWEQNLSTPDIYLIPQIACFFNISIDTLFGTEKEDMSELLVSRYAVHLSDKNYRDAKEAVEVQLSENAENLKVVAQLCKVEYLRAMEYFKKSKDACERLREGEDIAHYRDLFEKEKTAEHFNYLLIALGEVRRYEEMLRVGKEYIASFMPEEQRQIYPNLMEAAYCMGDLEYAKKCFQVITEDKENKSQVFNAWWLLWKTCEKAGEEKEALRCREELLRLLPEQGYNEYMAEQIKNHLMKEGEKPITVL